MLTSIKRKLIPHKLSEAEIASSQKWVIGDGIFTQITESLTAGPIVVALALLLGASNAMIGYLLALPFLCYVVQLPGVYLFEHCKIRKTIVLVSVLISRLSFIGIAFLAFFPEFPQAAWLLIGLYSIRYFGSGFISSGWNSWMKDLIPAQKLGSFFSRRLMLMMACALSTSLIVAFLLDLWPFEKNVFYGFLALIALILSALDVFSLFRVSEPPKEESMQNEKMTAKFRKVFSDKNFMRLVLFLSLFNFSINLAVPFFSVFVLNQLEYSLSFALILLTVMQLANILVMSIWGSLADKFSNKSVLAVSAPLYVLSIFLFLFTSFPEKHVLTVPLLFFIYFLAGLSQAGVTLATNNIALKLADKGLASVYLSVNGVLMYAMAGTAPIIGGLFADYFATKELALNLTWKTTSSETAMYVFGMQHWDFFFFFAAVLGLFSLGFLKQVREEGEVDEKIVMSLFVSSLFKNLSATYMMPQKLFIYFTQKKHKKMDDLAKSADSLKIDINP